jgi:hypothetical protein
MFPTEPSTNNPPPDNGGRNRDRFRGRGDQGGAMSPMAPSTNTPPPDNRGRNRDRGGAPPSQMAPTNNPPADNNGNDRRGKKDRKNRGDSTY